MKFSRDVGELIKKIVTDKWILKGHNLSGSFIKSLEVNNIDNEVEVMANEYGSILNKGVKPNNIPYSGRSGQGGKSKYLTGLQNYVKLRMGISDERQALSIAFAIAEKHKRNGIIGSGFMDEAIKELETKLDELVIKDLDKEVKQWL